MLIYSNTTINQYFETYILHSNVELAKYDNEFIIEEGRERFNSHINVSLILHYEQFREIDTNSIVLGIMDTR